MDGSAGKEAPLGALLIEQGALKAEALEHALDCQAETGGRLGDILLEEGLVSRPLLDRVLSQQMGTALDQEEGFGSGLRGLIERRHLERMGLPARTIESSGAPPDRVPPLRLVERRLGERRRQPDRRRG